MKKTIRNQAESSSFSIGIVGLFDGGAKISVRQFQNLNNPTTTLNGLSQGDTLVDFYSQGSFTNPNPTLLQNLLDNGVPEDISKFFPLRSESNPTDIDYLIPGFGEFTVYNGVNYLVLCLPCELNYAGTTNESRLTIGWPVANFGNPAVNYQDSLRLEVLSSIPPNTSPQLVPDSDNIYRWQYFLPLAKITLGNDIDIENYETGFLLFQNITAVIPSVPALTSVLPLHLLSSFY